MAAPSIMAGSVLALALATGDAIARLLVALVGVLHGL